MQVDKEKWISIKFPSYLYNKKQSIDIFSGGVSSDIQMAGIRFGQLQPEEVHFLKTPQNIFLSEKIN